MTASGPRRDPWYRRPWILPGLGVLAFLCVRLVAALCVGDEITPMGSQEAKHTELAWTLAQGTFGSENWTVSDFLLTAGNLHHAGFLSVSVWFWLLSKIFGSGLLALRLVPIVWWTLAVATWAWIAHRRLGPVAAALVPAAFVLAPIDVIGTQMHANGSHTEVVLPLALLCAAFCVYVDDAQRTTSKAALAGYLTGYAFAFSYLMWPVVLFLLALGALPAAWWSAGKRLWIPVAGFFAGTWPLLLLIVLQPRGLFTRSITEDESSVMGAVAAGGKTFDRLRWAFFDALELEWQDQGLLAPAGRELTADGGIYLFRAVLILGAVVIVPAALRCAGGARRLGLLIGLLPVVLLGALTFTTPFEFVRQVYVLSPLSVGLVWPAAAVGLGLLLWTAPGRLDRALGVVTAALGVAAIAVVFVVSAPSAAGIWQPDRAGALTRHRYSAYWMYGIDPVTAGQVDQWNDLIDVRESQREPMGAYGLRMTIFDRDPEDVELREDAWILDSWEEVRGNFERAFPETFAQVDLDLTAHSIGWGLGIRTRWSEADVARIVGFAEASGRLPPELAAARIWEGWGFGRARAEHVARTRGDELPAARLDAVPPEHREAVSRGMAAGVAMGAVPRQRAPAALQAILAGPT